MNSKLRMLLAGAACIAACAIGRADPAANSGAPDAGPAVDNPVAGPAPSAEYVWMSGHWNSVNGQWKWVASHWDLPPNRSAVWVEGHWAPSNGQWVWVNGAWNVAQAPQSPSAPPAQPGAAYPQGMPTPYTPPPGVAVAGQQSQVVYQQPGVGYYDPAVNGAAYPGYYWNGDAWAWGFYPSALYLGFGWGGWGHGGWGHGFGGGGHFR